MQRPLRSLDHATPEPTMKSLPSLSSRQTFLRDANAVRNHSSSGEPAFTRLDCVAILAVLALLAAIALPVLANTRPRADQLGCLNNTRQILQAFHLWAAEHDETLPWWRSSAEGGTLGAPLRQYAWFQFSWMSNELRTPKILHDPADRTRRMAESWSDDPDGGFLHPSYRNQAVSYVLGIDATMYGSIVDFAFAQQHILLIDRHLTVSSLGVIWSSGIPNLAGVNVNKATQTVDPKVGWADSIHGAEAGGVGLVDGSAHSANKRALYDFLLKGDDNGSLHLLYP